ncbi:MAG: DUF2231 domain-containing protein [Marmoricola sp.]
MFDTINGIPMHPLIVHGVVVLLPLAILGTIAIAARPTWRARYGYVVLGIAVVATALVPAATQSGEAFEKRVGDAGRHRELGDQLIWFALPLLVLAIALVVLDRRAAANPGGTGINGAMAVNVVAALAVLAAIAAGYQVYRVGDSGARAAWCGQGQPAYSCTRTQ